MILLAGCAQNRALRQTTGDRMISKTEAGVRATLTFLPQSELIKRYGERHNPYLPPATATNPNEYLLFELRVKAAGGGDFGDLRVNLSDIELQFSGKIEKPTNRFHFINLWERFDRQKEAREYDLTTIKNKIDRTLLENENEADGGSIVGLILFREKLPTYGEATVYVPVYDQNGRLVHRFEYDFEF